MGRDAEEYLRKGRAKLSIQLGIAPKPTALDIQARVLV